MNENKLVKMGECGKPHGIKGEFLFHLINAQGSAIKKGSTLTLMPKNSSSSIDSKGKTFEVESIRFGNKVIAKLKDIADRNIVEQMIPFYIWIKREEFGSLDEDEVYLSDLVGVEVYNLEDEKIGVIKTFYDNGAQPVLVVKLSSDELVELPFVESFFPEVNIDKNKIVMNNPGEY